MRGLRYAAALTLTATLAGLGALANPESAHAYRSPTNPATLETHWSGLYGQLRAAPNLFPCETTTTCTPAKKTAIMRARQAVSTIPKMRALGTLAMGAAAFDIGWSIGRTIDTKWLHLSAPLGVTNPSWTTLNWIFNPGPVAGTGWYAQIAGTGFSLRATTPWPATARTNGFSDEEACTAAGNGDWVSKSHCGSQWSMWRQYQLRQVAVIAETGLVATMEEDLSVSHCGQGIIVGVADGCFVPFIEELVMEETTGANGPLLDADPTPGTTGDRTTSIASPTQPAWGSTAQQDAVDALLEDEAAAEAAAGTPAEEDTGAWEAGVAADPTWEGYPEPETVMPDCTGLTVAACESLLSAAGHTGTITELELDIATADVTKPAGAVVTTSPAPSTSFTISEEVTLNVNPDPMPLQLPEPNLGETYTAYLERLQTLGYVGTATVVELTEATGDPALGPDAPVTISTPQIQTQTPTTIRVGAPWPTPAPRVYPDTDITVHVNPPTYAPVPNPGGPASGPVSPPGVDFSPVTDIDWGCRFPWGLVCYAIDVTEWFDVAPDAPAFTFDQPEVTVLSTTYGGVGTWTVDLDVMDEYMELLRDLMSVALWIGAVYLLASRLLNFRAAGDPGQAVDEGLDWQ